MGRGKGGLRGVVAACGPVAGPEQRWRSTSRRSWPRSRMVVVAFLATAVFVASASLVSVTAGAVASTVIGGTGVDPGATIAQDPVSLTVTSSGGLDIGDGTAMVVRSLATSGVGDHRGVRRQHRHNGVRGRRGTGRRTPRATRRTGWSTDGAGNPTWPTTRTTGSAWWRHPMESASVNRCTAGSITTDRGQRHVGVRAATVDRPSAAEMAYPCRHRPGRLRQSRDLRLRKCGRPSGGRHGRHLLRDPDDRG